MLWGGGTAEEGRGSRAGRGGGTSRSREPTTTSPDLRPSRPTDPVQEAICVHLRANLRNLRSATLMSGAGRCVGPDRDPTDTMSDYRVAASGAARPPRKARQIFGK